MMTSFDALEKLLTGPRRSVPSLALDSSRVLIVARLALAGKRARVPARPTFPNCSTTVTSSIRKPHGFRSQAQFRIASSFRPCASNNVRYALWIPVCSAVGCTFGCDHGCRGIRVDELDSNSRTEAAADDPRAVARGPAERFGGASLRHG